MSRTASLPLRDTLIACDGPTAHAAAALELVFGSLQRPWSFRLWNQQLVHCGSIPAPSVVHFKSRDIFRQLFSKLDLVAFAEAYINGELDFEGDLFDVMERAAHLQMESLPWKTKLKIWSLLRKI